MKLQLQSLRVIGCGPLKDVLIDFCDPEGNPRPVIILAGANGSGKTTVLELIVSACHSLSNGSSFAQKARYVQLNLAAEEKSFNIVQGVAPTDFALAGTWSGEKVVDSETGEEVTVLPPQSPGGEHLHQLIDQQRRLEIPLFQSADAPEPSVLVPSVLYFPHNRSITRVVSNQVFREETTYKWVYRYDSHGHFEGSLDSYLIWLDYAEPETFARVQEFLNSLDFDGKTFSIDRKELKAVVTTKDGSRHYLEDLSSGEQNILIMLLELRRRLLPYSIVLIDEIENSLHPAFQYRLAQNLLKMQQQIPFQLIVTTHAVAFVDVFGEETLRVLTDYGQTDETD